MSYKKNSQNNHKKIHKFQIVEKVERCYNTIRIGGYRHDIKKNGTYGSK